ncbi:MAG: DUF309 domain-containing protein [Bacteroidetes bacterium]|nr:DUF309 domain-containing protein [Bacteroidota bacterium]MBU1116152.1 DUF309 domain-containing protein [Bacteroidota bacterium]MBU1800444.1 DUF309 domain-containing protein [Bacteroidota bacterium]
MNLKEGIELFNDGSYFEAHDYFEEMWMEAVGNYKNFYKGLIQASVGSYHLTTENYYGTLSQYTKCLEKLEKYPDNFGNIKLLQFRQDINYIINQITIFYSKKNHSFKVTKILFIELNT